MQRNKSVFIGQSSQLDKILFINTKGMFSIITLECIKYFKSILSAKITPN